MECRNKPFNVVCGTAFALAEACTIPVILYLIGKRRDSLHKPAILLFLLCINLAHIFGVFYYLLRCIDPLSLPLKSTAFFLGRLFYFFRGSLFLFVAQRLCYMLQWIGVISRVAPICFSMLIALHFVLSMTATAVDLYIRRNDGMQWIYVYPSEIAILVLFAVALLYYWTKLRTHMRKQYKAALLVLLLAQVMRVAIDTTLALGREHFERLSPAWRYVFTLFPTTCIAAAVLYFLVEIAQRPHRRELTAGLRTEENGINASVR